MGFYSAENVTFYPCPDLVTTENFSLYCGTSGEERWIAAYPAMRLTKMFGACPAASAADPLTSVPPSPI
jgi:hypothetical protein